jgi:hypothetical protein
MSDAVGEKALVVVNKSRELIIKNKEDLDLADKYLSSLSDLKKVIEAHYDDLISAAHKAWKMALAKKAEFYNPVDEEAKQLKQRIGEYKLQKEAERRVEEERLMREAIEAEMKARVLDAEANPEFAEVILSAPITVAPVVIPSDTKTTARFRTTWNAVVEDFEALVNHAVEKGIVNEALLPNEKFLRKQAESYKENLHLQFKGVRSFSKLV